ncbi:MAG: biopolymer transporter Tol [Verrucomicrobiota bacterium]|jgi:TolB protein
MKKSCFNSLNIFLPVLLLAAAPARGQNEINIEQNITVMGMTKPIPVSLDGFTGEVANVLRFDLYVQGFSFVSPDAAQYLISGSNAGNVQGRVTDRFSKSVLLARSYTGASLRREAHAFADDMVLAITGKKGIAQTKIAFKVEQPDGNGEIYVADFDGYNPQAVTHDGAIVAAPAWVPGRLAVYYTSYKLGNPDIFYHDLSTGQRRAVARYSGLNTSAAVSPDGTRVAMILSKAGSPNVYVGNADGTDLKRLTTTSEDSSPCWSPDGQWICFATKINSRRLLAKVPAGGGSVQRLSTAGVSNPTEPDWSPDGKWLAFTAQMGEFDVCVVPAGGGTATVLTSGEDPSWAPNSRTLVYARRTASYRYVLSLLDAPTKQVKDVARVSGSDSQPAWAR